MGYSDKTICQINASCFLTHFMPLISFDTPWKQKTISGMKWVNKSSSNIRWVEKTFFNYFPVHLIQTTLFSVVSQEFCRSQKVWNSSLVYQILWPLIECNVDLGLIHFFYVPAEIHKWLKLLINIKMLRNNLISNKGD